MNSRKLPAAVICVAMWSTAAWAQSDEKELATVEIGAAGEQDLREAGLSLGPSLAVVVTPVENWLELEAGIGPLFRRRQTEWDADFLFKKPWTLSKSVEFMAGIGPE